MVAKTALSDHARVLPRGALLFMLHSGCGPNVGPAAEDWMIGSFSSREPAEWVELYGVQQYHVHDTATVELVYEPACDGCTYTREWESRGSDSFVMHPDPVEPVSNAVAEFLVRPQPGKSTACGPYEVVQINRPDSPEPGEQPNADVIFRGAVCQRTLPACPDPPADPHETGDWPCGGYALEWCDEAPGPCEDD